MWSKALSFGQRADTFTKMQVMTAAIAHEVKRPLAGMPTNASTCLWIKAPLMWPLFRREPGCGGMDQTDPTPASIHANRTARPLLSACRSSAALSNTADARTSRVSRQPAAHAQH